MADRRMPGTNNSENYSVCHQYHLDGCGEAFPDRSKRDDLYSLNCTGSHSQLSASSSMSKNIMPTFVYQRRRPYKNSGAKHSDGAQSAIRSDAPSVTTQVHMVSFFETITKAARSLHDCSTGRTTSSNGCSAGEESLISDVDRVLNVCHTKDDVGECSSSGAMIAEKVPDEMSEGDLCLLILRNRGLLEKVRTTEERASAESTGIGCDNYCSKACKICEHLDSTSNMLICDSCMDAFHMSCCNPCIKRIPVGEWFCSSCLKQKRKILKKTPISISMEMDIDGNSASEGKLGSLEFMLRKTEPYMFRVKIGDDFQADVPDWSIPVYSECDLIGDQLEMDASDNFSLQSCNEPLNLSSVGNWLQCQQPIEGVGQGDEGAICGKWRRAPLSEDQTDNWECFNCLPWDPAYADCAVPQEVPTKEVMKQLKSLKTLRSRVTGKRRKVDSSRRNGKRSIKVAYSRRNGSKDPSK